MNDELTRDRLKTLAAQIAERIVEDESLAASVSLRLAARAQCPAGELCCTDSYVCPSRFTCQPEFGCTIDFQGFAPTLSR